MIGSQCLANRDLPLEGIPADIAAGELLILAP